MYKLMLVLVIFVSYVVQITSGLPPLQDLKEHIEEAYVKFDGKAKNNLKSLLKFLHKPSHEWRTPEKLRSYPSSCDQLTYCERDSRPAPGVYKRLPIYPWWYYSCKGTKVNCKPCPTTGDLNKPTLFFSERCQQCISEFKDENIACPSAIQVVQKQETWWSSLFRSK